MIRFLWVAAVLGILYGVPGFMGACGVRALLRPLWTRKDPK